MRLEKLGLMSSIGRQPRAVRTVGLPKTSQMLSLFSLISHLSIPQSLVFTAMGPSCRCEQNSEQTDLQPRII